MRFSAGRLAKFFLHGFVMPTSARVRAIHPHDPNRERSQVVHPTKAHPPRASHVRVAYLIDRLSIGGTEKQLLALIKNLDRSRIVPYLVLLDGEAETSETLDLLDVPVVRLGVRSLCSPHAVKQLRKFIKYLMTQRIDILQLYFPDSTYFGALGGRLAGIKAIIRTRNNINHWMTPAQRRLGRLLNRHVALTICNSEAGREAVLRDERPKPESVVVIPNGVDLEQFAHIPRVDPTPGRQRRVGMLANLRTVKGVDLFIQAASRITHSHPNVEFVVAGEGEQRAELERLVDGLGLNDRFLLPGQCHDVPSFLATLDIAVLSSRAEGTPNAVLEYMAAGRPVLATAVGGVRKLIEPGVQGMLVQPENVGSLVVGLNQLLSFPETLPRLGESGRRLVREQYGRDVVVSRFTGVYEKLARKHAHVS